MAHQKKVTSDFPPSTQMTKKLLTSALALLIILSFSSYAFADEEPLNSMRIKTDFNIWKVNLNRVDWIKEYPDLSWNGFDIKLPEYLTDDQAQEVSNYLTEATKMGVDKTEIKAYLEKVVAPEITRDKQDVSIDLSEKGDVVFDGFAFHGQEIDYEKAYHLFREAYLTKEPDVRLPIKQIDPEIKILSDELRDKGITKLISTGETNFSGSPYNRRNNIKVGLNSFDKKLIPPGEEGGAGDILGTVDQTTGYLEELVIKGDKTVPEYGGGLCQVSTTVYRSLLFGGFPITQRRNHSYAVSYYDPQGLDATIYPPSVDLKFLNDTPGHILIQTVTVGDKAYSNVYGTPVDRHVDLIGPYYYDYKGIPPSRTEYTDKLKPGEKKIVGGAHAGFKASWYRRISHADEAKEDIIEHIYSDYQARPLYTLIGEDAPAQTNVGVTENGT